MLGSTAVTMKFAHMSSINLTEGSANATVTSDAGINTFTAGAGKLIVTGGSGADAYIFHKGDGTMTVNDFSLAKGDALTIDLSLKGAAKFASDGHGGTMISFGTATSGRIDLVGAAGVKAGNVHFA
jgi:serralysin